MRSGSRTPAKLAEFSGTSGIPAASFSDVAAWAETIVLAVLGRAADDAIGEAGPANVAGKVVIDTTNPIDNSPPEDGVLRFFTGPNESLMEKLQAKYPEARFIKAFSCVGNALMVNPQFGAEKPTMFYCGNDEGAKAEVGRILQQFGWDPADMGTAKGARADRAALPALVHPGIPSESVDACVPVAESLTTRIHAVRNAAARFEYPAERGHGIVEDYGPARAN